jgi:hypothetical protein
MHRAKARCLFSLTEHKTCAVKTEKDLNYDILKITMIIQGSFPELSKYLEEMPVKTSDTGNTEVTPKNLSDYYDSLDALLKNYARYHNNIHPLTSHFNHSLKTNNNERSKIFRYLDGPLKGSLN